VIEECCPALFTSFGAGRVSVATESAFGHGLRLFCKEIL
jgi:hypothetical protein